MSEAPAPVAPVREAPLPDLKSLPPEGLGEALAELGERPFRARQVGAWLHQRFARSFAEMSDLSKALRAKLEARYTVARLSLTQVQRSRDGTVKFGFTTWDGRAIESVYIPEWSDRPGDQVAPDWEPDRQTLCVSTQVGCAMGCAFCMTGTLGLIRNLEAGEILEQVYQVNRWLTEELGRRGPRPVGNLVFMGMGEPLHNYEQLKIALDHLVAKEGPNYSTRHVTVSTSGLVPAMRRLVDETDVRLAVSLTGTTDADRDRLMPVNRRWDIQTLLDTCRELPLKKRDRVTFEYVLLRGETDSLQDAERLARLLRGLRSKVNLIAYNAGPGLGFERPDSAQVEAFRRRLVERGLTAVVRRSRGQDIDAACGQLAAKGAGAENASAG